MWLKKYWREACLVAVLASVAAGCDREEVGEPVALAAPAAVSSLLPAKSDFKVMIAPDPPRSHDALRVVSLEGLPIENCRWEINGEVIEGENNVSLPPGFSRKGDTVSVIASARGAEARAAVRIVNTPPKILELPFSPVDFFHGVDITVTSRVEDQDGDPVSFAYLWSINDEEIPWVSGATLSGDRFRRGDRLVLQVTPFDGEEHGEAFLSRAVVVPNAPPDIVSIPPASFESRIYRYQVKARDPDGDSLTFVLANAPEGMSINKMTGEIVWEIGEGQAGEHRVRIEALDEAGDKAFQEYTVTISLPVRVKN